MQDNEVIGPPCPGSAQRPGETVGADASQRPTEARLDGGVETSAQEVFPASEGAFPYASNSPAATRAPEVGRPLVGREAFDAYFAGLPPAHVAAGVVRGWQAVRDAFGGELPAVLSVLLDRYDLVNVCQECGGLLEVGRPGVGREQWRDGRSPWVWCRACSAASVISAARGKFGAALRHDVERVGGR